MQGRVSVYERVARSVEDGLVDAARVDATLYIPALEIWISQRWRRSAVASESALPSRPAVLTNVGTWLSVPHAYIYAQTVTAQLHYHAL